MTAGYESELTLLNLFDILIKYSDNNEYVHTDNDGDFCIKTSGHTIFIYFEQSDSWGDWMSNFDFPATAYKNSDTPWNVHRGFLRVWKSMKNNIEKDVKRIINERRINEIICVGYSHGAAICGLCVEDLRYMLDDNPDIYIHGYGFGCPRFTWGRLPREVKERLDSFYVIRNGRDIVTHVPPKILGYGHGPNKIIKIKPYKKYNCVDAHRPESYHDELTLFTDYKIQRNK